VRIVHVVIGGALAGGQRIALELAKAVRERGDTVTFVSPSFGEFTTAARGEGFEVDLVDMGRTFRLDGATRFVRTLHRQRADLVHTHTLAAANALSRLAARAARIPVISHLHIENNFRPSTAPILRTLDNSTARFAARLIAVSEDTRRAYEQQGYPKRIEVVYNGVALPVNAVRYHNDPPVIGEVARFCDVKGQRELIQALASVARARLILAGRDLERDGEYQTELEREAERVGVGDRVEFGFRNDVGALLDELDVLALPSWTEGLPLVVLEAMAHGKPVVATPVGGTPELVTDGETGLLVPPRDPKALAAALQRLLDDAELSRRLGEAGRRRVEERFSLDAMNRRVLQIYDEVVA